MDHLGILQKLNNGLADASYIIMVNLFGKKVKVT